MLEIKYRAQWIPQIVEIGGEMEFDLWWILANRTREIQAEIEILPSPASPTPIWTWPKVILDISFNTGHIYAITEHGAMFVKFSRSDSISVQTPALTQSSKSSSRCRTAAANHLKPSSFLRLIKPMARRINLRSQFRQCWGNQSAACRRYSTSPPSLATSTARCNTRRLAFIWLWFVSFKLYVFQFFKNFELFSWVFICCVVWYRK